MCVGVCVFLYKLHSDDHNMHFTNKRGTFTGSEDIGSGLHTFKGLLGGLRLNMENEQVYSTSKGEFVYCLRKFTHLCEIISNIWFLSIIYLAHYYNYSTYYST